MITKLVIVAVLATAASAGLARSYADGNIDRRGGLELRGGRVGIEERILDLEGGRGRGLWKEDRDERRGGRVGLEERIVDLEGNRDRGRIEIGLGGGRVDLKERIVDLGGRGGLGGGLRRPEEDGIGIYAPPKYEFKYGIGDPKTGDRKEQQEVRVGDRVKGEYSLAEPDGTIRIVRYEADDKNGFNARVERIGKALHPQIRRWKD